MTPSVDRALFSKPLEAAEEEEEEGEEIANALSNLGTTALDVFCGVDRLLLVGGGASVPAGRERGLTTATSPPSFSVDGTEGGSEKSSSLTAAEFKAFFEALLPPRWMGFVTKEVS